MIPCIKCNSNTNGYYSPKSRTCRICTNKITVENRNRKAKLKGYNSYYQEYKLKKFESEDKRANLKNN